jgi:hypothetical protein
MRELRPRPERQSKALRLAFFDPTDRKRPCSFGPPTRQLRRRPTTPRTSSRAMPGARSRRPSNRSSNTRTNARPGSSRAASRQHPAALPDGRRAADRRRTRPACPLHLPRQPPPPDPQREPARAAQQGDPGAPRWSASSPTGPVSSGSSGWSSPSRTTSGRTAGAASGPVIDAAIDHEEVSPG